MSKFEKFFASKNIMFIFFFIAAVMYAFKIALSAVFITTEFAAIVYLLIAAVMFCTVMATYHAYSKHETNALNTLVGALLGLVIALAIYNIYHNFISPFSGGWPVVIAWAVQLVLILILYVNHIQINSSHESVRSKVVFNQVMLIVLAAYQIVLLVMAIAALSMDFRPAVSAAAECIAGIGLFIMIICIETRLNAYKIEREASIKEGTWTDEKKEETKDKYFNED